MAYVSGKTAQVIVSLWFDEDAGDIHITIPRHRFSTVNERPESVRGNPHLFNKLAKALRD